MPYWSIYCLYCGGYIVDALLECVPAAKQNTVAYLLLFQAQPGAALACPYCNGLIGFDGGGKICAPASGWPVLRYGQRELELKKLADGEPTTVSLVDWALKHRFTSPGTHKPLGGYTYAEQAPLDETVP
jgi:hypothetical protein